MFRVAEIEFEVVFDAQLFEEPEDALGLRVLLLLEKGEDRR